MPTTIRNDQPPTKNTYVHNSVSDAEYRIRKMRATEGAPLYSVTEYYKGDRIQLCDTNLTRSEADALAKHLADRNHL